MKILVVSNMYPNKKYPNYGVFVKTFCEQLSEIEIDYDLIKMHKETNRIKKSYSYCVFFGKSFFKTLIGSYDYVYVHYVSISAIAVLLAKKIKKVEMIANVHGSDIIPENNKQTKKLRNSKLCLIKANKIVVPSTYFKTLILKKYSGKVNESKIFVYPSGGINSNVFYKMNKNELKKVYKKYNFSFEKKYYGYCGRIDQNKGIDTLLNAISLVTDPDYKFLIIGSGAYEKKMHELIEKKKLKNRIQCFGMMTQKELNEIYNVLQCFIFPTERKGESLGLVAIEAMACGTPVIASDYAAPKYYIEDNYNGLKYPIKDSMALVEKIKEIANMNDDEYEKLENGALDTARKYYRSNIESILKKIFKK